MPDTWQLLTSDERERRRFASLAAVLSLASTPAGPKNRWRHVARIDTEEGTFFLKTFVRTQWKNRLWFRLTAPRARDDAERELLVTTHVRAVFDAPRPVAYGRRGRSAYYLCAGLPGRSCRDLLAAGEVDWALRRQVARHCGGLLHMFWLPDLSADHVFAWREDGRLGLGVLDLHNGTLAPWRPEGPHQLPPRWVLLRLLRRFARSVRGLPVTWTQGLWFAVRLLRSARYRGADARAVLRRLPPFVTATRYEVAGKSDAYANRNPRRAAREQLLLQRVWPGRAGETVLDLPCGTGRLLPLLAERYGQHVVHADGAMAMLRQARDRATRPVPAVQADALAMPFRDGAVDGVVLFRFLHHLPPDQRRRAIAEACRTARRFVVASFFHPCSAHHVQRCLQHLVGGNTTRFAVRLGVLRAEFAAHGFTLHGKAADLPFARDLWVASFVRAKPAAGAGGD